MKHRTVTASGKWVPNFVRLLCGDMGRGAGVTQIQSPVSHPMNNRTLKFDQMV